MVRGNITKRHVLIGSAILILALLGFGAGILLASAANSKPYAIPKKVAEQALFPTYLPDPLPKGYSISENSFHIEEGALLFQAVKGDKKINFAEQPKPKDFDFTAFYQQQLTDTKKLQDVPYTSVLGKTKEGNYLLSIIAGRTWLIITSPNAAESDLRTIAEHLRPQEIQYEVAYRALKELKMVLKYVLFSSAKSPCLAWALRYAPVSSSATSTIKRCLIVAPLGLL